MALNSLKDMSRFQHRRRIAVAIVIGMILVALLTIRSAWSNDRVHEYIEDFGIGVIVLTILGRMWCTLYIGGTQEFGDRPSRAIFDESQSALCLQHDRRIRYRHDDRQPDGVARARRDLLHSLPVRHHGRGGLPRKGVR